MKNGEEFMGSTGSKRSSIHGGFSGAPTWMIVQLGGGPGRTDPGTDSAWLELGDPDSPESS